MKKLIFVGLAILVLVILLLVTLFTNTNAPPVTLPTPNGWDTYQAVGNRITPASKGVDEMSVEELRANVLANESLLPLLHQARDEEFMVPPLETSDSDSLTDEIMNLRNCFRLLMAEAALSEKEERWEEALQQNYALVTEARKLNNNGLLIQCMVGAAYEDAGAEGIVRVAPKCSSESRAALFTKWKTQGPNVLDPDLQERDGRSVAANPIVMLVTKKIREKQYKASEAQIKAMYQGAYLKGEQALAPPETP